MVMTREICSTVLGDKICITATSFTTNAMWNNLGLNAVTNPLGHDMDSG